MTSIIGFILFTFLIRVIAYSRIFESLEINKNFAAIPCVGDWFFLKKCTKKEYSIAYLVLMFVIIISACLTFIFGEQMKVILAQGIETYTRINGKVLPYHAYYKVAKSVLMLALIVFTILRFIICGDVRKAFGRPSHERWLLFILPPIGYLNIAFHEFKYFGNPYDEDFVDFSQF